MGMAGERHGHGMLCVNRPLDSPYVISDGRFCQEPVRVPLADRIFSLATF